ncbi:hypothetical protein ACFLUC_00100 [Chloroflexota bacterium]
MTNQNWVIIAEEGAVEMGIASWLAESENFWTPSRDFIQLHLKCPFFIHGVPVPSQKV